ncbi:MAG: amidase [Azospirillaceae bacterium]
MSEPTVHAIARSIEDGERSCRDWVEFYLDRIARADTCLKTVITPTTEAARSAADRLDREHREGRRRGPLHGVPYGLKDVFDTAGVRTTAGSRLLLERVPGADAAAVERLTEAGAVLLGKLETVEFCLGGPSDDGAFPPAANPWNADCYAGGSSSGSGAAVAGGLMAFTLGTDTAGSVRLPACFSGCTGFKPGAGRIDRHGIVRLSESLDEIGPLARTARDCALVFEQLAGTTIGAPANWPEQPRLDGWRIGFVRNHVAPYASAGVAAAVSEAIGTFERLGATIVELELPALEDYTAVALLISLAEAYALHRDWLADRGFDYTRCTRQRISLGAFVDGADLADAYRQRQVLASAWEGAFADVDLLLACGAFAGATPAKLVDAFYFLDQPLFGSAANVAGAPSIAVPAGFDANDMPVGIQLSGPRGHDQRVLESAHAFQGATPWLDRLPPLHASYLAD